MEFNWLNGVYYPNGFYASLGWHGHNGIDYGCWTGDPVEAVCDGVIEFVGSGNGHPLLSGGGQVILLRSDKYQMRFEYLHLSQQNVYTGQKVTKGQVIGLSGNTGVSSAPHLHLGAIPVGNVNQNDGWRGRVDPTPYLYGTINNAGTIAPQEAAVALEESDRQRFKEFMDDYFINVRRFADNRNIFDAVNQTRTDVLSTKAVADGIPQKVLFDNRIDGRNLFDWAKQIRADIAGIKPGTLDIPTLAAALAEQLPKADVAELAKQLQITVKEVAE